MQTDRPVRKCGWYALAVTFEINQTSRRDTFGVLHKTIKRRWCSYTVWNDLAPTVLES